MTESIPQNAGLPATAPEQSSPEQDQKWHFYQGNEIPWYVRVIWIGFWICSIWYIIQNLLPALQIELISPP